MSLSAIHVDGIDFKTSDGKIFKYVGTTEFALFKRWLMPSGPTHLVLPILEERKRIAHEGGYDGPLVARVMRYAAPPNAFAIDPHPRCVPDDVLRLMPANGGVVHVNFIWEFVSPKYPEWQGKRTAALKELHAHVDTDEGIRKAMAEWDKANEPPRDGIAGVADHIDHIRKVAGIDHIGVGADFYDVAPGSMVVGLQNVTRYPYLFAELLRRGYSDEDVLKIAGRNHLRAMHQMEKVAVELQKSETPLNSEGLKGKWDPNS